MRVGDVYAVNGSQVEIADCIEGVFRVKVLPHSGASPAEEKLIAERLERDSLTTPGVSWKLLYNKFDVEKMSGTLGYDS